MATNTNPLTPMPVIDESTAPPLTREEWWELVESLFGSAKEAYAEVGGSDAFMRAERAAWEEDDLR